MLWEIEEIHGWGVSAIFDVSFFAGFPFAQELVNLNSLVFKLFCSSAADQRFVLVSRQPGSLSGPELLETD